MVVRYIPGPSKGSPMEAYRSCGVVHWTPLGGSGIYIYMVLLIVYGIIDSLYVDSILYGNLYMVVMAYSSGHHTWRLWEVTFLRPFRGLRRPEAEAGVMVVAVDYRILGHQIDRGATWTDVAGMMGS